MKQEPKKVTFEIVTKDGKDYLFVPKKDWFLIADVGEHYVFNVPLSIGKLLGVLPLAQPYAPTKEETK